MTFFEFMLVTLASFRLTRLIMYDEITERIRLLFIEEVVVNDEIFYRAKGFIGKVILCYWCCGIWVAIFLNLLYYFGGKIGYFIILILAVAAVASIIEFLIQGDRHDD
jgi:hypothetical protein